MPSTTGITSIVAKTGGGREFGQHRLLLGALTARGCVCWCGGATFTLYFDGVGALAATCAILCRDPRPPRPRPPPPRPPARDHRQPAFTPSARLSTSVGATRSPRAMPSRNLHYVAPCGSPVFSSCIARWSSASAKAR